MPTLAYIFCGLSLFATLFAWSGGIATWVHRARRRRRDLATFPPVSLLKPIKGAEEQLTENLRSVFAQDYPGALEVVFSAEDLDDPGISIARTVAAEFPHIPSRFVRSDPTFGYNPKVANLAAALQAAVHELVLQSDANVRLGSGYLRAIVAELLTEKAVLLSSVVVGDGEASVGAAMENLQLSARIVPSTCFAWLYFRHTCVIGKSMLFPKSALAEVGGLAAFRDTLAEDYLLGQAFEQRGKKVVLSAVPVVNVNADASVERFSARHARWLKMRAVIHAPAFVADLFANPVFFALLAWIASKFSVPATLFFGGTVVAKIALDAVTVAFVRGRAMRLPWVLLGPVKDVLIAVLWPYAALSRKIEWRGVELRMGRGSRLTPVLKDSSRRTSRAEPMDSLRSI